MNEHPTGGGASRSTDVAAGSSAATDVSLREYLTSLIHAVERRSDLRFDAIKDAVQAAFEESQKAIQKAEVATEKRFESVNEFRETLSEQAAQFVTRDLHDSLQEKLQQAIDRNREDLDELEKRLDLRQGEIAGNRLTKASLYAAVGVTIAFIGLIVVVANYLSGH